MKHRGIALTISVLSFALLGGVARAQSNNAADQQFVLRAHSINRGEIELGRMAEQKGTTPEVRSFGERMVKDHTAGLRELEAAAGEAGVPVPSGLLAPQAQLEHQLTGLSGRQFDDSYIQHMVAGHNAAIAAFHEELDNGRSLPLRSYAERMLPLLESHEQGASQAEQQMRQQGR
jgi:putative membrane protein